MEKPKTEKARDQIPLGANTFSLYIHPILGQQIVKSGFSWPGFLLGPIWLISKKLWAELAMFFLAILVAGWFIQKREIMDEEDLSKRELEKGIAVLAIYFVIGSIGNVHWKENLLKRGYVLSEKITARSTDEVRAILARRNQQL